MTLHSEENACKLPHVFLANIVSLLPGTSSATLDRQALKIDVTDSPGDFMTELKALAHRVARTCGVLLAACHGGE
jgi:multicomponent Na+:H+ antiporter subunit E